MRACVSGGGGGRGSRAEPLSTPRAKRGGEPVMLAYKKESIMEITNALCDVDGAEVRAAE